jgi:hypothetical protein
LIIFVLFTSAYYLYQFHATGSRIRRVALFSKFSIRPGTLKLREAG